MNYHGPGTYRHYKGGLYQVLGLALQEDTVHKSDQPEHDEAGPEVVYVIYRPLSEGSLLEQRSEDFWARELGDFDAYVDVGDNQMTPRFYLIEP